MSKVRLRAVVWVSKPHLNSELINYIELYIVWSLIRSQKNLSLSTNLQSPLYSEPGKMRQKCYKQSSRNYSSNEIALTDSVLARVEYCGMTILGKGIKTDK